MTDGNKSGENGRGGKATSLRNRTTRANKAKGAEVSSAVQQSDPGHSKSNGGDNMSTDKVLDVAAQPAKVDDKQKPAAIALHQPTAMVGGRPVMPSDIEVAETVVDAGIRPIAVSHLELAGSFLNGRPIEASHLKVHNMLPGDRPVFESDFKVADGALLPGNRPIMASSVALLEASVLIGNRPIASNDTVDPEPSVLMGYLD